MIVMIFCMVRMASATCLSSGDDDGVTPVAITATPSSESTENCNTCSMILLPGLSLENLLLFLLCTPCQVCIDRFHACIHFIYSRLNRRYVSNLCIFVFLVLDVSSFFCKYMCLSYY